MRWLILCLEDILYVIWLYFIFIYLIFMFQIVLYFLHSTLVLTFCILIILTLPIFISRHLSTLTSCRALKFTLNENKRIINLHSQYHSCWWPEDAKNLVVGSKAVWLQYKMVDNDRKLHAAGQVLTLLMMEMEYSGFGRQYHPCWCTGS